MQVPERSRARTHANTHTHTSAPQNRREIRAVVPIFVSKIKILRTRGNRIGLLARVPCVVFFFVLFSDVHVSFFSRVRSSRKPHRKLKKKKNPPGLENIQNTGRRRAFIYLFFGFCFFFLYTDFARMTCPR